MPLPATYMKVTLCFRNTNTQSTANCVLWYVAGGSGVPPTQANISTAANGFKTAYSTAVQAALNEHAEMYKVTLKYVTGGAEMEGDNTNGAVGGGAAGDCLPEEDVICIQKRTGLVGRSKRGRIFFPYVSEDFQNDGELGPAGVAAASGLATMVKSFVVASPIGEWQPAHLDNKNGILIKITQTGYVLQTCSRRDRRSPKVLQSVRI